MKEIIVFGITIWMLVTCMSVFVQDKKTTYPQFNKAQIKTMEKEGWYVADGRSLFSAFNHFDSIGRFYAEDVMNGILAMELIGFSCGEHGPNSAISKAEENAVRKYTEVILSISKSHSETNGIETRCVNNVEYSVFKSVEDSIWWNFPMPEFVLLRDRGYGHYDCQSYYLIDGNFTHAYIQKYREITHTYRGESIDKEIHKVHFYEKLYRENMQKMFEELNKE